MRRSSLVGPMLIILIGVVFLVNTLRPDLPLIEMAATWWPVVLMGWGVLRLAEILIWAARGRPLPAAGLGGGEWTLVVLICLFGTGLYFANAHRPWENFGVFAARRIDMFGHQYDFPVADQRQPASKAPRVLIENLRGNARIVTGDALEVRVGGRKTVRALQQTDADDADRQSPLEVSVQGDQVVIRTNQDRVTGDRRISTDLDITVPKGATIEGRGREGDFEIADVLGNVEITSDNAGVRLQNIGGNVRIDLRRSDIVRATTVKGSVDVSANRGSDLDLEDVGGQVTVNGAFSGDLRFQNLAKPLHVQDARGSVLRVARVPGSIQMDLGSLTANKLVGPIRFSGRTRDIQIDEFSEGLEISLDRGDVNLRPLQVPLSAIDVRTHSGQVDLALPEAAKFEIRAVTNNGDIENNFGPVLKLDTEPGERHGATLQGGTGKGTVVTVTTGRGSITVRKDSGTPLPLPERETAKKERITVDVPGGKLRIEKN